MPRIGTGTVTLNQTDLNIANGWISSSINFTPQRATTSSISYTNSTITMGPGSLTYNYLMYDSFSPVIDNSLKRFITNRFLTLHGNSLDFYRKTITIAPTVESKLKFNVLFTSVSNSVYTANYLGLFSGSNLFSETLNNGTIGLRVLADGQVVHAITTSYFGPVEVTLPPGTTSVVIETYDTAFATLELIPEEYKMVANYSLSLNNIRIHVENSPSFAIGSRTDSSSVHSYIQPNRIASLSVNPIPANGYYTLIYGAEDSSYFNVGDKWYDPNYLPQNTNRNACIEFDNVNYSLIDIDAKIELVIDVIDIETDYAEEVYDDFSVNKVEVREFYQFGARVGIKPLVSVGSFPADLASVSAGSAGTNAVYNISSFKPGINIYDITSAVRASILAQRPKIVLWLTYDKQYARDKYINFKIGNSESNKPRIRYRLK